MEVNQWTSNHDLVIHALHFCLYLHVVALRQAIRKGLIKFDNLKELHVYLLWEDESHATEKSGHLAYIPALKPKFPGHTESYNNTSQTQEEFNSYQLMYEEDRRSLYLKGKINFNPESLKPKPPSQKGRRPYPTTCYLEYRDVLILNTGLGNEEEQERVMELLVIKTPPSPDLFKTGIAKETSFLQFCQKISFTIIRGLSYCTFEAGDDAIVGSREGRCHPKDLNSVTFHRSYPLFASCSDDRTACVFHGMVYSDLNQNPLIILLEILGGHKSSNGGGVMDCKFHPRQPWLFTTGADSLTKLYCH
ncbi:hypothetical protein TIFTF001_001445 [Ficus carica]|uniref:BOP1 N-terminal domain-containing protein n=1 Tax=Ficus carica TaxID=3494 RepID=A0AA87ZG51_FICCA|nr:hypothetical protein TIFTF001_001445 [Ficus carica]